MSEVPKRRWFQFSISTMLIFTMIVAWAIALRPWADYSHDKYGGSGPYRWIGISFFWNIPVHKNQIHENSFILEIQFRYDSLASSGKSHFWRVTIGPAQIALPTMAMIALLGWKRWRRLRRNSGNGELKSPDAPATQI
jgi:hypothetical protein